MTAPALITLFPGSLDQARDQRSASTVRDLTAQVRDLRPDLTVDLASLGDGPTALTTVASRLAYDGVREAVLIPLQIVPTTSTEVEIASALDAVDRLHLNLGLTVAEPVGLHGYLLNIVDERLRDALSAARVRELDALVLVTEGTDDPLVNQSLLKFARVWGTHHRLPTSLAFTDQASPSAGEAVRAHRAQGKRHVAVAPLFIAQSRNYYQAFELATEAGAITVSEPLGAHEALASTILSRYAVGALDLVSF